MKSLLASTLLMLLTTPVFADDAVFIIREYRPHCRSRVTEITRIPKIEPIATQPQPTLRYKSQPVLWIDKHHDLGDYSRWLPRR